MLLSSELKVANDLDSPIIKGSRVLEEKGGEEMDVTVPCVELALGEAEDQRSVLIAKSRLHKLSNTI